ncbi:glycosyltransferase [Klebsiella variicola subsp. variicola]|uniref:glycosyltransferase n=1 Tax=Klebsiella variicola TaxID=244366 RepID=UPI0035A956C8
MKKCVILIPSYESSSEDLIKTIESLPLEHDIFFVDDGSQQSLEKTLMTIYSEDNKFYKYNIKVLTLSSNQGIERALAAGIKSVANHYEYIARMDVGDVQKEGKIAKQIFFLDHNSDYVIVGTWADFINKKGDVLFTSQLPTDDISIRKKMFINNMFVHPSVVMRSSAVLRVGNYSDKFKACEDYDLFFRLLNIGKGYNLPISLLNYEVSPGSISSLKRNIQVINRIRIILDNFRFKKYGFYPYYGLLRNIIMLLVGRNITTYLRKILGR